MKPTNPVFTGIDTTVFETMSRLAMAHNAVNLGQGFPDVDGPDDIREVAAKSLMDGPEPVSADAWPPRPAGGGRGEQQAVLRVGDRRAERGHGDIRCHGGARGLHQWRLSRRAMRWC